MPMPKIAYVIMYDYYSLILLFKSPLLEILIRGDSG